MDLENWMSALPEDLKNVPIIYLAIPGTHNSMTYGIDHRSKISPDAEDVIRRLDWIFPCVVRRWAITQSVDVLEQLRIGVRYFDLRICFNKDAKNLYYAHGLFAMEVMEPLTLIKHFLDSHSTEVVILDFQHFYDVDDVHHRKFHKELKQLFGNKLFGTRDGSLIDFTLNYCKQHGKQIILIYRRCPFIIPQNFWPSYYWPTPWPNVCNTTKLKTFLDDTLKSRQPTVGYVSQCILTPTPSYISLRWYSSLKTVAKKVDKSLCEWIKSQKAGAFGPKEQPKVNIFIGDFVHLKDAQFCKWIIDLNLNLNEECFVCKDGP